MSRTVEGTTERLPCSGRGSCSSTSGQCTCFPGFFSSDGDDGAGNRGAWGEITSTSNCLDFQARRLNIRYRDAQGKLQFAHTLNGTAISIPRAMIALVENHQQADGSIRIPTALVPYLGANVIGQTD